MILSFGGVVKDILGIERWGTNAGHRRHNRLRKSPLLLISTDILHPGLLVTALSGGGVPDNVMVCYTQRR